MGIGIFNDPNMAKPKTSTYSSKILGSSKKSSTTINFYSGTINKVDKSTRSSVMKAYKKAKSMFPNSFTNGLVINVASDFSNLPKNASLMNNYLRKNENSFSSTKGITTDDMLNREIYIQESAFLSDKFSNIFSKKFSFSANNEIEQATMHELGHSFDYYYGADKELQIKHQKLIAKYGEKQFEEIKLLPEEEKIMKAYMANNGYSDKKDFKDALAKDLQKLKFNSNVQEKFGYFLYEFYDRGIDVIPNAKDIEAADYCRSEVFAQLFSYAMGTDDGNKKEFIKLLPNTYKIVQNYINHHSL